MKCVYLLIISALLLPVSAEPYLKEVAKGLKRPIDLVQLPDDSFLALQQNGIIYHMDFKGKHTQILNWEDRVSRKGNEQGLLGIALAPDFEKSGRLYLNLNNKEDATEIWRLHIDPADPKIQPTEPEKLLVFDQPYRNHNGGWMGFGPDGYLYIGAGDGGSANDPQKNAQDLTNHLGKILRIDVSEKTGYTIPSDNPAWRTAGAKKEIFAYGLRNPWRCSWHGQELYIADVGQNKWEEINITNIGALNGANFGWRPREGDIATPNRKNKKTGKESHVGGPKPKGAIDPVYVYPHDSNDPYGGLSVTGGFVYEGPVSEMKGRYFFADYVLPRIWSFVHKNGKATDLQDHSMSLKPDKGTVNQIASFAIDNGSLSLSALSFKRQIKRRKPQKLPLINKLDR